MPSGVRANGFQTPLSKDQVTSWILQPFMMSVFIAFVAKLLDRDKCIGILVPTGVLIAIILCCWYICESRDPSVEKSKSGLSLLSIPPKMTRYCTLCCKTSPGLDHHCTWLNTCIADNNYEAFFFLAIAATVETVLQAVVGILMATIWFDEIELRLAPTWHSPMLALLWVHNAIMLSLANSYILLAGFHIYLVTIRSGTYDFILENGNDGICARMLKCKCLTKSKGKHKNGDKRQSMSKTVPAPTSSKVVAAPTKTARGDGPTTTAQETAASAAKKREMEEWKANWIRKYGSDESDDTNATGTESQPKPIGNVHTEGSSGAAPTYPAATHETHDQVQIEMTAGVHESEGIFQDVETREADHHVSPSSAPSQARTTGDQLPSHGAKTEL